MGHYDIAHGIWIADKMWTDEGLSLDDLTAEGVKKYRLETIKKEVDAFLKKFREDVRKHIFDTSFSYVVKSLAIANAIVEELQIRGFSCETVKDKRDATISVVVRL